MQTDTTTGGAFDWLRRVDVELDRVIGSRRAELEEELDGDDDRREIAGAIDEASGEVFSDASPGL